MKKLLILMLDKEVQIVILIARNADPFYVQTCSSQVGIADMFLPSTRWWPDSRISSDSLLIKVGWTYLRWRTSQANCLKQY